MDEAQWDNPAEIYNVYTPKELRDLFSGINISSYLASLGYEISDNIVVYDKNLASTINSYLKRSNLKLLKLYLKAAVLDCSALYPVSYTHLDVYTRQEYLPATLTQLL